MAGWKMDPLKMIFLIEYGDIPLLSLSEGMIFQKINNWSSKTNPEGSCLIQLRWFAVFVVVVVVVVVVNFSLRFKIFKVDNK